MAHDTFAADAKLRDYLHASAVDFRQLMSDTLEGHRIENGETVWEHLSHRVDALIDGRPVEISRYELPDWHNESPKYGGDPGDRFVLDVDDVLRPAPESPRVMPNRAQRRRAAGWRGPGLNGEHADGSD